jgi:hypothetical protein
MGINSRSFHSLLNFLIDVCNLNVSDFTFIINDLQEVFLNLQDYSDILVVIHDQIISLKLRHLLLIDEP